MAATPHCLERSSVFLRCSSPYV